MIFLLSNPYLLNSLIPNSQSLKIGTNIDAKRLHTHKNNITP